MGQDVQRAHRLGRGLRGAVRRAPRAAHRASTTAATLYRDGDYFGREVNLASRVVARARGGEVLVTDSVVIESVATRTTSASRTIGQVKLKGFDEPRQLCRAEPRRRAERPAARGGPRRAGLVGRGEPLLVLLSGGGDSVCLLDVAMRLGAQVSALHVNYGLRADGRRRRGALPRAVRAARGAAHGRAGRAARRAATSRPQARDARYALAERLAEGDYAAAHTASDQAETVLYRLAVSPGRRALLGHGAAARAAGAPAAGGHPRRGRASTCGRARPRLARGPVERRPPLRARARAPRRAGRAARARARPPSARSPRRRRQLREEAEVLDAPRRRRSADLGGGPAVPLGRAASTAAALRAAGAARAGRAAAGGRVRSRGARPRRPRARASAAARKSLDLGGGLRAVAEYGTRPLRHEPARRRRARAGRAAGAGQRALRRLGGGGARSARPARSPSPPPLGAPAAVRAWREGDRMRPVGLGGTKTLQDLFTDRKVPRALRRTLPVVEAGGEIVWVAGVALDERFAARAGRRGAPSALTRALGRLRPTLAAGWMTPASARSWSSSDDLAHRVRELAEEISRDYEGRDLLLVGRAQGRGLLPLGPDAPPGRRSARWTSWPCPRTARPPTPAASCGSSRTSTRSIEGREVLIVEDIVDSGLTLSYLLRTLKAREPGLARGLRAAHEARAAQGGPADPLRGLRDPEPVRRSATASTTPSASATCPTWRCWTTEEPARLPKTA